MVLHVGAEVFLAAEQALEVAGVLNALRPVVGEEDARGGELARGWASKKCGREGEQRDDVRGTTSAHNIPVCGICCA